MKLSLLEEMNVLARGPARGAPQLEAATPVDVRPSDTVETHLGHAERHAQAAVQHHKSGKHDDAVYHAGRAKAHLKVANEKQRAEDHPSNHRGEKMVFGVWRKIGELKPEGHANLADAYKQHAGRLKSRANIRSLLTRKEHPSALPSDQKERLYSRADAAQKRAEAHAQKRDPMGASKKGITKDAGPSRPLAIIGHTVHGSGKSGSSSGESEPDDMDDLDDFDPKSFKSKPTTK